MPIVREYQLPAHLLAQGAYIGAGAATAEEQRRLLDAQAEERRQFDLNYDYQIQQAELANQMSRSRFYQQGDQFNAKLNQQVAEFDANSQLQWAGVDLGQQRLDQNAWAVDQNVMARQADADARNAQANAAVETQRMNLAAAQQQRVDQQKMSRAIRAQQEIQKFPFRTQAQYDSAIQQWEQMNGMDWDFPQRAVAEQQIANGQQRRTNTVNAWSKLTGLEPDVIDGMVMDTPDGPQLSVPPQVITGMAESKLADQRMRDLKAMDLQNSQSAAERKLETDQAAAQHSYQTAVQAAIAKARTRYFDLLGDAEKSSGLSANGGKDLPDDLKLRLWQQALVENPKPQAPPGM